MPLRSFKPVTPSNRYKMWPTYEEITKKKPEKGIFGKIFCTDSIQFRLRCHHYEKEKRI